MKFASILLMFIVQAHSSAFDDFQDAMSSIQNGFQKLITDVVTDVKDTIDCTVIAVESAFSLGVANYPQNPKCKEIANGNLNIHEGRISNGDNDELSPRFLHDTPFGETNEKQFSERIEVPMATNKETIFNTVTKKHFESDNLKQNRNVFDNDTDRVNDFFKSELNISSSINDELKMINSEQKSISDSIIKHINMLQDVEHSSRNNADSNVIRPILDETSKMLNVNVSSDSSDGDKISKILTTLDHSKPKNDYFSDVQSTPSSFKENRFIKDDDISANVFPKTFKEIFTKVSHTTPSTINENDDSDNNSQKKIIKKISQPNASNNSAQYLDNNSESIESLFDRSTDDDETHQETLEQAKKIIEDHQRINSILNSFFAKADQSGTDVFDNPLE